jgi:hypothetical protein
MYCSLSKGAGLYIGWPPCFMGAYTEGGGQPGLITCPESPSSLSLLSTLTLQLKLTLLLLLLLTLFNINISIIY